MNQKQFTLEPEDFEGLLDFTRAAIASAICDALKSDDPAATSCLNYIIVAIEVDMKVRLTKGMATSEENFNYLIDGVARLRSLQDYYKNLPAAHLVNLPGNDGAATGDQENDEVFSAGEEMTDKLFELGEAMAEDIKTNVREEYRELFERLHAELLQTISKLEFAYTCANDGGEFLAQLMAENSGIFKIGKHFHTTWMETRDMIQPNFITKN